MAPDAIKGESLRTFLALPLAETFLNEFQPLIRQMQKKVDGVKWVLPEQVHITLHFFGRTAAEQIPAIRQLINPITEKYASLHLRIEGIGFFPNAQKPRVIWMGVAGESMEDLMRLQSEIEKSLGQNGFPIEERPFRAHATIGRVKESGARAGNLDMQPLSVIKTETRAIDKIVLFQSALGSEGPRYETLEKFYLSAKPGS